MNVSTTLCESVEYSICVGKIILFALQLINKVEIKSSIENRFNVKVKKVAVINCKGKNKNMSVRSNGRVIRTNGNRSDYKKAIVTLIQDQKIDLVDGDFS